ncbi:hypothetical protein N7457_000590 [Penicillium paradoxum]|uniref:uncharacterized protein n=1 Tax=Penicillium paradoxum TaxID=176176 RepID=UPI00254703EE|nr:uncharacterized protein N7457_000590 [Penicillium paradoxum]KAJ5793991.1 hypothetical protein N7457_000590 [Penicillium paradoxum]
MIEIHVQGVVDTTLECSSTDILATYLMHVLDFSAGWGFLNLAVAAFTRALRGSRHIDELDEPEFNIPRLLRIAVVYPIWEDTANILASEFVRFLMNGDNLHILPGWLGRVVSLVRTPSLTGALKQAMTSSLSHLICSRLQAALLANSRRVMFIFAWILSGAFLTLDAERIEDEVAMEIVP